MTRRLLTVVAAATLALAGAAAPAEAQSRPRVTRKPGPSRTIHIGGYGTIGLINFTAVESFDAVLGNSSGPIFGGGATVGLPLGGLFVDIGGWRFKDDGERVLILDNEVLPLGIPLSITVTTIEISAGWRFRFRRLPRLIPYAAAGYTSYGYQETSEFATPSENVDERFGGYQVMGGAEVKLTRWLGLAGEVAWSTVRDSIGETGVSAAFDESDLGGRSFRLKLTVGR